MFISFVQLVGALVFVLGIGIGVIFVLKRFLPGKQAVLDASQSKPLTISQRGHLAPGVPLYSLLDGELETLVSINKASQVTVIHTQTRLTPKEIEK